MDSKKGEIMFLSKYYHRRWVESLKVGDWIENCNYRIEQIIEAEDTHCFTKTGYFIHNLFRWFPWFQDNVLDYWSILFEFSDKELILSDGASYSGMYCCNPPLEKWIDYE